MSADADFILPYDRWAEILPAAAFYPLMLLITVILFYLLYAIANRHLSWSLEHLARYLRMSPDIAGLTLLAFGNGAPDFFTALFGSAEAPELILAGSVGAGLFITTVVFGLVIIFGRTRPPVGDLEKSGVDEKQPQLISPLPGGLPPQLTSKQEAWLARPSITSLPFLRSTLLYLLCIAFLGIFAFRRSIPLWQPCLLLVLYASYLSGVIFLHYWEDRQRRLAKVTVVEECALTYHETDEQAAWDQCQQDCWPVMLVKACWSLAWKYAPKPIGIWPLDATRNALKIPFDLLLNLTIPPVEDPQSKAIDAHHLVALRLVHRLRVVLWPWAALMLAYAVIVPSEWHPWHWPWGWLIYVSVAGAFSVSFWFTTGWRHSPRGLGVHIALAFAMSILWIYLTSKELVSCLASIGQAAGISTTILGITVLAWGNSFGDLVANVALARAGALEMAVTASFCGPIQNVLLTLGTGFLVAGLRADNHLLQLTALRSDIYVALVLLLVSVVLSLAVIAWGGFRLARWLGIALVAMYAIYLPVAIGLGIGFF